MKIKDTNDKKIKYITIIIDDYEGGYPLLA